MSEDRPKKSWREIDRTRDGSQHRRDEPAAGRRRQDPRRQRSYRAQLDRLFESGKIGELVEKQTGGEAADPGSENRLKAIRKIIDAEGRSDITKVVDAYLEAFDKLPDDFDVLAKVLEHRDPSRQLDAMEKIRDLLAEQQPKRTRAAIGQLKLIRDTSDEPEMVDLARELIDRLE